MERAGAQCASPAVEARVLGYEMLREKASGQEGKRKSGQKCLNDAKNRGTPPPPYEQSRYVIDNCSGAGG